MTDHPDATPRRDPFDVLGLSPGSNEERVRARYLELVKLHPPERDPERFREIHRAYEAARDPLAIAEQLVRPLTEEEPRPWRDLIAEHRQRPPRMRTELLLSLGNRAAPMTQDNGPKTQENRPS